MKHVERSYIQHDCKRKKLGPSYSGNEEKGMWEAINSQSEFTKNPWVLVMWLVESSLIQRVYKIFIASVE